MTKHVLNPEELGPAQGAFSHGVRAGDTVWVSAQAAQDAHGRIVGDDDPEAQCRVIFKRIEAVLAAGGATFSDVVMLRGFLRRREFVQATWNVRREVFGGHRPASTSFVVSDIEPPGALMTFEVVAIVERS
jgi:enamine deaminase RidA (YjgF/YER057c/UK114 family)